MRTLDVIVAHYSNLIKKEVKRFGMDIPVADIPQSRKTSHLRESLVLSDTDITDDSVALMISGAGAVYNRTPVGLILTPLLPNGNLLVDDCHQHVAARFFYEFHNGIITPTVARTPLPLDGINVQYSEDERTEDWLPGILNCPHVQHITNSKILTKEVLKREGLPLASCRVLRSSIEACPKVLEHFLSEQGIQYFVIKAEHGSGGNQVRLFEQQQIGKAVAYARKLLDAGDQVLLEQRLEPLEWRTRKGIIRDWNIRAFVTLEEHPRWIDGLVRYDKRSCKPVNICQGARVEELETVAKITCADITAIKNTALKATTALYKRVKDLGEEPYGFLGLDLMATCDGVYVIEINDSAAGGFAELMEMRLQPLQTVADILLPACGAVLAQRRKARLASPCQHYRSVPVQPKEHYDLGCIVNNSGHFPQAIRLYNRALAQKPDLHSALLGKGIAFENMKKYKQAITLLKRYAGAEPEDYRGHEELGIVQYEEKQLDYAIPELKQAIALKPKTHRLYQYLANAYCRLALDDEAIKVALQGLVHHPNDATLTCLIGLAHYNKKEYDKCIRYTTESIKLNPSLHLTWYVRGAARHALKQLDQAEADFEQALTIKANDVGVLLALSEVYIDKGAHDAFTQTLEHLLTINPTHQGAHSRLGHHYFKQADYEEAAHHLKHAQCDHDHEAECNRLGMLGESLWQTNNCEEAKQTFEQLLTLKPDDPSAILHLLAYHGVSGDLRAVCELTERISPAALTGRIADVVHKFQNIRDKYAFSPDAPTKNIK
ncbi:tetratricopeptide repeat protein [Candidatus Woesearchaeota archaeon]|nr:tetratricopeptide repeat protein [Candidatus Woesearchaeota archaeon]